jgi:Tubulin-tyrosine ligase family
MMQSAHDHKNIWLLKPTGLNRGRGIHIFTTLEELRNILIDNYDVNFFNSPLNSSVVAPNKNQTAIP